MSSGRARSPAARTSKVDASQQVFAEAALSHGSEQVAARSADQLKIVVALAIGSNPAQKFFDMTVRKQK